MLQQWNCAEYHHMQWHHSSTGHTWLLRSQSPWGKTGAKMMSQPASLSDLYPTETLCGTEQKLEIWLQAISFCQNCASDHTAPHSEAHWFHEALSSGYHQWSTMFLMGCWAATVNGVSVFKKLTVLISWVVLCVFVQVCRLHFLCHQYIYGLKFHTSIFLPLLPIYIFQNVRKIWYCYLVISRLF